MMSVATKSNHVIKQALGDACEALSLIAEYRFQPDGIHVSHHDPLELATLWEVGEDVGVCAAFCEISGDLPGYLLIVFPFMEADMMARLLLGTEQAERSLVDSALGEVANILGSSFLNHLADHFKVSATPSPPQVVWDKMGTFLQTLATAAVAQGKDHVPIVRTSFIQAEHAVTAYLLWMTDADHVRPLVVGG